MRWQITLSSLVCIIVHVSARRFDTIIVGGGAGGLALAGKLTEDPSISVAVVEAGFFAEQTITLVPELYRDFIGNPNLDWEFVTVPQKHANNSILSLPRGKTLGGTSAVNGMYFVRASHKEYDAWQTLGNPGWNFSSVNEHIKSIERFTPASPSDAAMFHATDSLSNHGTQGPINVTYSNYWQPNGLIPAYFDTLNKLGVPTNNFASGGETFGVWQAPTAVTAANRSRSYSTNGFFTPNKGRENFVVITGAQVTKVLYSTNGNHVTATGVEYLIGNETSTLSVTPRGGVVIAAGTYQTPKILELSGIGNASILAKQGVPIGINLPGVGENLQDHLAVVASFELKPVFGPTLDFLTTDPAFANTQLQDYLTNRTGALASVPSTTVAMIPYQSYINATRLAQLKQSLDRDLKQFDGTPQETQIKLQRSFLEDPTIPQVELVMLPILQDPTITVKPNTSYLSIAANNMRPFSRGTVHINTTDPTAHALIDPNYLGITEFETGVLAEALKFIVHQIAQTAPLKDLIQSTLSPSLTDTDAQLSELVKGNIFSSWHPCGSASMLPIEQGGVVDPNLLVYGTTNIRVADASFIPLEIGTHTMATIYGNSVKAAEIIKASFTQTT